MFGIFGKKKKNGGGDGKKPDREEILAQAKANAAKARAEIGDENIQKMAEALRRMNDPQYQSEGKRAQGQIKAMDKGHVADNLKIILKEDK